MYRLIFIPKNLVVTNWPLSPYHAGTLVRVGSTLNEPRGCLSMPTATAMSATPATMALAACWIVAAPVAQALNTFMNGMPVRPSRPVSGSVWATSQLPPKAHWTSVQSTSGVGEGEVDGVGAHVERGLVAEPAERVEADPDDGDVVHLRLLSCSRPRPRRARRRRS